MAQANDPVRELGQIVLFADLTRPELHEVDRLLDEEFFDEGRRILRSGIHGSNFYVILEGEASVQIEGVERARLMAGDYFGDTALLVGGAPEVDVVATAPMRCRVLARDRFEEFLLGHPRVMLRMLQSGASKELGSRSWRE